MGSWQAVHSPRLSADGGAQACRCGRGKLAGLPGRRRRRNFRVHPGGRARTGRVAGQMRVRCCCRSHAEPEPRSRPPASTRPSPRRPGSDTRQEGASDDGAVKVSRPCSPAPPAARCSRPCRRLQSRFPRRPPPGEGEDHGRRLAVGIRSGWQARQRPGRGGAGAASGSASTACGSWQKRRSGVPRDRAACLGKPHRRDHADAVPDAAVLLPWQARQSATMSRRNASPRRGSLSRREEMQEVALVLLKKMSRRRPSAAGGSVMTPTRIPARAVPLTGR